MSMLQAMKWGALITLFVAALTWSVYQMIGLIGIVYNYLVPAILSPAVGFFGLMAITFFLVLSLIIYLAG